jgi:hypothetical protein
MLVEEDKLDVCILLALLFLLLVTSSPRCGFVLDFANEVVERGLDSVRIRAILRGEAWSRWESAR